MRVLDICCRAGGVSMGLVQAGCEVVGVDIDPQPEYPFDFLQSDALTLDLDFMRSFDWIWASPPCQNYSLGTKRERKRGAVYPDILVPLRERLYAAGIPFVIENVPFAPLRKDLLLCGTMFHLKVIRHRIFEIHGLEVAQPYHPSCAGRVRLRGYCTVAGTGADALPGRRTLKAWREAMGIDWMSKDNLREAIPPAYSRYIAEYATGRRQALPLFHELEAVS